MGLVYRGSAENPHGPRPRKVQTVLEPQVMIKSQHKKPMTRKRTAVLWGQLADLCKKIHRRLYMDRDRASAIRYKHRLGRVLEQLPASNLAVIRAEGTALLHELKEEIAGAIAYRKKEIELMERLQKSVQESVDRGDYDAETAAWALQGRDSKALQERRAILRSLEEQRHAFQRDGISKMRSEPEKRRRQVGGKHFRN
jgi:hypothetical protein